MKKELRLSCKVRTCFFVVLSSVLFLVEVGAQHFECAYDLLPLEEAPHPHDSVGYCYNRLKTCDSPDYFPFYQNWSALDTAVIRLNFHFIKTGDGLLCIRGKRGSGSNTV